VGRREVALPALVGGGVAAVPALLLVVLFPVDRHGDTVRESRDVEELGLGTERAWPVVVAARLRRTNLLGRIARVEIADAGVGLDVLARIVVEWLAGLLIDALGPVHFH